MLLFYTQMAKICSTLNTVYEKQMERLERLDLTFGHIWSDLVRFGEFQQGKSSRLENRVHPLLIIRFYISGHIKKIISSPYQVLWCGKYNLRTLHDT